MRVMNLRTKDGMTGGQSGSVSVVRSESGPRWANWLVRLLVILIPVSPASADQLRQLIPLDQGRPEATCVRTGSDGIINSIYGGDDTPGQNGRSILSGANGICESTVVGGVGILRDPIPEIEKGRGMPHAAVIRADRPSDGICTGPFALKPNDPQATDPVPASSWVVGLSWSAQSFAGGGDDVPLVLPEMSKPNMAAVTFGADGVPDTEYAPGGDDQVCTAICPGTGDPAGALASARAGDDILLTTRRACAMCANPGGCILPGPDYVLQTVRMGSDVTQDYISTGADGISQTTKLFQDKQEIPFGKGFVGTICVDAGDNGIAETTLCGNGVEDSEENGLVETGPRRGQEGDDGNWTSGDGVSATCVKEFCGDGIVQDGEPCDVGSDPDCVKIGEDCALPSCGDGKVHRKGHGRNPILINGEYRFEECDPPGDLCDADCQFSIQVGNGELDSSEECDDGNKDDRDDCVGLGRLADCNDEFFHRKQSDPDKLKVRAGLVVKPLEECSPPGTEFCDAECHRIPSCGDGIVDPGEACDPGKNQKSRTCRPDCGGPPYGCGDGIVTPPEECEPPFTDTCSKDCKRVEDSCCDQDGQFDLGEACDDGNRRNEDGCLRNCKPAYCGDGEVHRRPPFTLKVCLGGVGGGRNKNGTVCELDADCIDGTCTDTGQHGICVQGQLWQECSSPEECGSGGLCPEQAVCTRGRVLAGCSIDSDCDTSGGDGVCQRLCTHGGARVRKSCTTDGECDSPESTDGKCQGEECDEGGDIGINSVCDDQCQNRCGNGVIDGFCRQGQGVADGRCVSGVCRQGRIEESCTVDSDCTAIPRCIQGVCDGGRLGETCKSDDECALRPAACVTNTDCDVEAIPGRCDTDTGVCDEGLVGDSCTGDTDCNVPVFQGICAAEECDPGIGFFCAEGASERCSDQCRIQFCGNEFVECDEECDLGDLNGPNSPCSKDCKIRVVGRPGPRECQLAWSLDDPPLPEGLPTPTPVTFLKPSRKCVDNDPTCDGDTAVGTCSFDVGLCVHVPGDATCALADLDRIEISGKNVEDHLVEHLRSDVKDLLQRSNTQTVDIDRCLITKHDCREAGSVEGDSDCNDKRDDRCVLGGSLEFLPEPLSLADQLRPCTNTEPVVVTIPPGGRKGLVKLKARALWKDATDKKYKDTDVLRLSCLAAPTPAASPSPTPTFGGIPIGSTSFDPPGIGQCSAATPGP